MFNIRQVIKTLKQKRKVFTSEADLQLELAWVIKELYPHAIVRREYCPDFNLNMHIDILVIINNRWIPIELKYKTKKLEFSDKDGCYYNLKEQSAQDTGCYDYIKDISRIEEIKENKKEFNVGYTIFITNDELYKKGPRNNEVSYVQFSLKDNRENGIGGNLNWNKPISGERNKPIELKDHYEIKWEKQPFSELEIKEETNKYIKSKTFYILYNEIK